MFPVFQLHLHQPILERVAQIGRFDGKHPSLACGTTAGKVFLHSPNERLDLENTHQTDQSVRFLNLNRKVSALCTGKFQDNDAGDTLVVGTQSSLLAYNVEKNSDIFYKDVPDGVNTMLFAPVPSMASQGAIASSQMVVVGGNCSLQGFDKEGNEMFWTVTGDNVRALTLCDVSGQGREELVAGSDDFEIRAFQQEDIVYECTETNKILALSPIQKQLFGYALANGTVGVYKGKNRAWRVKSKHIPTSIHAFDINGDGEKELVIGWNNGKFEARRIANGELVYKDVLGAPVAAIVSADYRMDGNEQVICCSTEGEIRGYYTAPGEFDNTTTEDKAQNEEKEVAKLSKQKAALQLELKQAETNNLSAKDAAKAASATGGSSAPTGGTKSTGAPRIPQGTRIQIRVIPPPTSGATNANNCLELEFSTENESVIKMVILYDYDVGIFDGESLVYRPPNPSSKIIVPLHLTKSIAAKLDMKILVGARGNNSCFHVFEETYTLPKFAMFFPAKPAGKVDSIGSVKFRTPLKVQQMYDWIQSAFWLDAPCPDAANLEVNFRSYKDGSILGISLTPQETTFRTNDMQLAAELVQDMCSELEWRELESSADFPQQMEEFRNLLLKVDEHNAIRLKLTGEMADDSNQIKNLVIRAEDARILNDMARMRRYYSELFTLNNQLLGEYTKRSTNHNALLEALKEVNNMIQLAAKLRYGNAKTTVISACRKAIKNNNIHALFYIVKTGREEHQ